jgi:hypothetical protein
MPESGIHICVLRGIQTGEFADRVSLFFAPLRTSQPIPNRVSCIEQSLAASDSPDRDIRVVMNTSEIPWHVFTAGSLAKMERSPLFLVDAGSDGSEPIIVSDIRCETSMMAGSMGLVIQVPLSDLVVQSMNSLSADEGTVLSSLIDVASTIYSNWPTESRFFFSNPKRRFIRCSKRLPPMTIAEEDQLNVLQIVCDLILASPLILGIWPPCFNTIYDDEHQFLADHPFQLYRFRDITAEDRKNPTIMRIFLSILRTLESDQFPIWMGHLMGDVFTVPVIECIRYLPHLYHLRCPIRYGEYSKILTSSVVPGSHFGVTRHWLHREISLDGLLAESYPTIVTTRVADEVKASIHQMESRAREAFILHEGPPIASIAGTLQMAIARGDREIAVEQITRFVRFNKSKFDPGRMPNIDFLLALMQSSFRSEGEIPFNIAGSGDIMSPSIVPMTPRV